MVYLGQVMLVERCVLLPESRVRRSYDVCASPTQVQMRNIITKDLGIKLPLSFYNQPNITIAGLMDVLRKNKQNKQKA